MNTTQTIDKKRRRNEISKAYRKRNAEKVKNRDKEYRKKNAERVRINQNKYRSKNAEKFNKRIRERRKNNAETVRKKDKEYYKKNFEKIRNNRRKYRKNNIEKIRKQVNRWHKKTMASEPLFAAKTKLRSAVRAAFKRIGSNKPTNTETLLGCSWEEAKAHFEKLFREGMSWDNHGEWHIDHIRPVSDWKEDELHLMNHISNLQPLWAPENQKKSDSFSAIRYLCSVEKRVMLFFMIYSVDGLNGQDN